MNPKNILTQEPVAIASTLTAVLNVLVLLSVFSLNAEQLAGINTAVVLILGLFVRKAVTPNQRVVVSQADMEDVDL